MLFKTLSYLVLTIFLSLPTIVNNATPVIEQVAERTLPEVVITAKKKVRQVVAASIPGYNLERGVNTRIHPTLALALESYPGPRPLITSLRRSWNSKSMHNHGMAVDFNWSSEMIEYLMSEEGQIWLGAFNLTLFIEGKPGSSRVKAYDHGVYKKYVFYNPQATGDHIHLNI
jgi:hypothetical protein